MSLQEYVRKRNFQKTAEPRGGAAQGACGHRFVIQKHAASRLHYDFRLELGGTLKSWAVPKGVPYKKGERRLAVHVEDHPVSYIDFEGTIPAGQYGGGTVMVWDRGTFEPLSEAPLKELASGKLHFVLKGKKLNGEWYLVRLRDGDEWLLIKGGEDRKPVSAKVDDTSVLSGKSMAALSQGKGRVWQSKPRGPATFKETIAKAAHAAAGDDAGTTTPEPAEKSSTRTRATSKEKTRATKLGDKSRSGKRPVASSGKKPGPAVHPRTRSAENERVAASAKPARRAKSAKRPAAPKIATRAAVPAPAVTRTGTGTRDRVRTGTGTGAVAGATRSKHPPAFIEPMKAQLVAAPPAGEWIYEIKFDGFRAMALRDRRSTRLLSRNDKDFAAKFPDVHAAVAALPVADAVIDGEIVALDEKGRSSFQLLQAYELGDHQPPLYFYAFDLLQLNGEALASRPLTERKRRLEALLAEHPSDVIRYSPSLGGDAEALLQQARELGLEGLIGKQPDSPYEAGRRPGTWIKLKLHREQEFVIGGYTPPGGSRPYFGALLVGYQENGELKFAGKVGTGFDVKRLRNLHAQFTELASDTCPFADLPEKRRPRYGQGVTAAEMKRCHWVKPVLVAQIKFAEWTRDARLRQPVFLGLREDKPARDVVRERAE